MNSSRFRPVFAAALLVSLAFSQLTLVALGQSRPQKPAPATGIDKKNRRPTEEEIKAAEEARKRAEEEKNAVFEEGVEKINTNIVTLDAVVLNKKTGQIITDLKKANFQVFENGVKQEITDFSTPESPITVSLVVEYSKWSEMFGSAAGGYYEPGTMEVIRPVGYFLSRFIKPPNDYASVIAFDIRPTPITDFTNDPTRLRQTMDVLLKNRPAFRENNLFDALKFALIGGRGDSVVLENSKEEQSNYAGMVSVKARRKAIILIASGIDTFSKTNYSQAIKIVQEAGIPIYIISTGNLFYKKYEMYLPTVDGLNGMPGRLTFLQAKNAMNTFAKESGGMHFEMTFESEVPDYVNSINALLRNQYSLSYDVNLNHPPGSKHKLQVKVDVNGDGILDDKAYTVQHRPYYIAPGEKEKKDKKK
jgi:Ca-activated chloride channel homolog